MKVYRVIVLRYEYTNIPNEYTFTFRVRIDEFRPIVAVSNSKIKSTLKNITNGKVFIFWLSWFPFTVCFTNLNLNYRFWFKLASLHIISSVMERLKPMHVMHAMLSVWWQIYCAVLNDKKGETTWISIK